jgi:hypothetical protein
MQKHKCQFQHSTSKPVTLFALLLTAPGQKLHVETVASFPSNLFFFFSASFFLLYFGFSTPLDCNVRDHPPRKYASGVAGIGHHTHPANCVRDVIGIMVKRTWPARKHSCLQCTKVCYLCRGSCGTVVPRWFALRVAQTSTRRRTPAYPSHV